MPEVSLFLLWPFLLFTIAGLVSLFGVGHDYRAGVKFLALSLVTIFLARERLILIGGALGFCAVQSGISFVLKHDWMALLVSICSSAFCLLLIRSLKDYKPSYSRPKGTFIADILIGLTSLGLTLALFSWIRKILVAQVRETEESASLVWFCQLIWTIAGGFHVPSPAGKTEGCVSLGQYRRITK